MNCHVDIYAHMKTNANSRVAVHTRTLKKLKIMLIKSKSKKECLFCI